MSPDERRACIAHQLAAMPVEDKVRSIAAALPGDEVDALSKVTAAQKENDRLASIWPDLAKRVTYTSWSRSEKNTDMADPASMENKWWVDIHATFQVTAREGEHIEMELHHMAQVDLSGFSPLDGCTEYTFSASTKVTYGGQQAQLASRHSCYEKSSVTEEEAEVEDMAGLIERLLKDVGPLEGIPETLVALGGDQLSDYSRRQLAVIAVFTTLFDSEPIWCDKAFNTEPFHIVECFQALPSLSSDA